MLARVNQDAVSLRLTAQTRTCRADGYGNFLLLRIGEYFRYFIDRSRRHYDLGKHAVWAGVGRVLHEIDDT
jgi:hypothetical protein